MSDDPVEQRGPRVPLVGPIGLVLVVGLGVALLLVVVTGRTQASFPGDDSAAAGFARDMSVHHDQAVAMAEIIRDRTDDEELRLLATDIALTQQSQIGRMQGWLDVWGLPASGTGRPLAWMGASSTGDMPGMVDTARIDELRTGPTEVAEEQFLRLMVVHHRGGVEMAGAVLRAEVPDEVLVLASGIVDSQRREIDVLEGMLADRSGLPSSTDGRPAG